MAKKAIKTTWETPEAVSRDPHEDGADGLSQFSNWSGYTEYQPGTTQSPVPGKLKPFPQHPQVDWEDTKVEPVKPSYEGDAGNPALGGAPDWKSHPAKPKK
jgi:hypothetical protein